MPLVKDIVEWNEYTGQFQAVEEVEIRSRVSGYLDQIHFRDGQIVEAGDLLFTIDPRPFEITATSARAQLAEAKARLDLAEAQLSRAERLRKNDTVSAAVYDERFQEMRAAAASVEVAEAALRDAELNLEYARITAPIGGRIGAHAVSIGNLVNGGSGMGTTVLTTIVSLNPIRFVFDISESELLAYQRAVAEGRMSATPEKPIEVQGKLLDDGAWTLNGRIDFIDNQVDRGAGTIRVRAVFANPNLSLTPGQFGRIRMPASDRYSAMMVPESALLNDQARKIVMTVAEDGTVVPKVVRPGPSRGPELRLIRAGLEPTDRIVINGLMRVQPGMKVLAEDGVIDLQDPEE
ncbi:MAG: efflux RND transporter periplasmic adaptor subunit [Rhodospirillales bacterium]|nr:efflux RND transporter periplasmic adaptor subunit [Rhodospirillales bacterium]